MKNDILYVEGSKFLAVLAELNIPHTVQSGFIRVEGAKGRRLYIAATKRVGRIDISGFEVDFGAKVPHCGVFGAVKQQMDLSNELTESDILSNFRALVEHMMTLPAIEKVAKVKAPKAPKAGRKAKPGTVPSSPEPTDALKGRMALIKKLAQERGVAVSSKTLAMADSSDLAELTNS